MFFYIFEWSGGAMEVCNEPGEPQPTPTFTVKFFEFFHPCFLCCAFSLYTHQNRFEFFKTPEAFQLGKFSKKRPSWAERRDFVLKKFQVGLKWGHGEFSCKFLWKTRYKILQILLQCFKNWLFVENRQRKCQIVLKL